ncbi:MAG: PCP reductase family protein [Pseudanabaenaceae cyanobacterium]
MVNPDPREFSAEEMLAECLWTEDALSKLQNVPYFARAQARQRIEAVARREGHWEITPELVERVRLENGQ